VHVREHSKHAFECEPQGLELQQGRVQLENYPVPLTGLMPGQKKIAALVLGAIRLTCLVTQALPAVQKQASIDLRKLEVLVTDPWQKVFLHETIVCYENKAS
jgi:hypothetical protein